MPGWARETGGVQSTVRIRLFGEFDLRLGGRGLASPESARIESLLAFLLLHRDVAVSRQRVAFLLWPDSTGPQARTNLRHVLHGLRRRLPNTEEFVEITPRTLRWRPDAAYWLDTAAFEDLLARGAGLPTPPGEAGNGGAADRRAALEQAVEIYRGDLLEGCDEGWLTDERDRLRNLLLEALTELAGLFEAAGQFTEAISHVERLLRGHPLHEDAYRRLMRLHDARGDHARALRVYHVCSSTLEHELGVEPSPATRAAYQVLLSGKSDVRPMVPARVGGAPMIGRAQERAHLAAAWRSTNAGQAQLLLVTGETGVGKTRLVEEFRGWCGRRGAVTAEARCYPAEGPLAYGPVVTWLRSDALRPRLVRLDRARLTEIARLLPELLVEIPDLEHPSPIPESDRQRRLFDAVCAALLAAEPLLLVVDDIQHGDRETCQFLHYLLRVHPAARLLVVGTARQEELGIAHPLQDLLAGLRARERLGEIELDRLSAGDTASLAALLTGSPLEKRDASRLHAETEGNPLFIVEAMRAGWQPGQSLSPRVVAVIGERLAQLSVRAGELVGIAAIIGREFSTDVLAAAAGTGQDALIDGLDELWRRRIIHESGRGTFGDTYDFSHDKIREVASLRVSPARRGQVHLRIARALEQANITDPGPRSAQIAAHFEQAGATATAVIWYRRAAEAAQLLHANARAIRLLERALGLLRSLPKSTDRDAQELELRSALLAPLTSVDGYSSPAVSATQQQARQLAQAIGVDAPARLLRSLALSALTEADFGQATQVGHLLRATGERNGDDVLVVEGAYVLGIAAFWQADFPTARGQFDVAVEHYRPADRQAHLIHYGQDPRVVCLSRQANTLCFLGLPDAARDTRSAALAWAQEIAHPYSRWVALVFAGLLALDLGDDDDVRQYGAELTAATSRAPQVLLPAAAFRGYVAVLNGETVKGIHEIHGAIRSAGSGAAAPGTRAILGRILLAACQASGDVPVTLAAADGLLHQGGAACVWEPEARRVRSELLDRPG